MGLIRNAVEQGRQAVESIAGLGAGGRGCDLDLVIAGAGPAGFAATLAAMERGLRSVTIEQDSLGGTVAHYPRRKLVMTAPVRLPLIGQVRFRETTKEELLEFWRDVERRTGAKISYHERLEHVRRSGDCLIVTSTKREYRARAVLLAIGRRGTPRRLGVPGEEQSKVVYRLIEPEQYREQRVLVVGGGDSALEAALAIAEQPGAAVHLSHRGDAFDRAKPQNRRRLEESASAGRLAVVLRSLVRSIERDRVALERDGDPLVIENDAVLVCAGGVLPTPFLTALGIAVETKHGTV
jgi:thioredoxin reductase